MSTERLPPHPWFASQAPDPYAPHPHEHSLNPPVIRPAPLRPESEIIVAREQGEDS